MSSLLGDKRAHSWDLSLVQTHGVLPFLTGFIVPLSVLRMSVCFSLLSRSWLRTQWASLMSDRSS